MVYINLQFLKNNLWDYMSGRLQKKKNLKKRQETLAKNPFTLFNGLINMAEEYLKDLEKPNIKLDQSAGKMIRFKRFNNDSKVE